MKIDIIRARFYSGSLQNYCSLYVILFNLLLNVGTNFFFITRQSRINSKYCKQRWVRVFVKKLVYSKTLGFNLNPVTFPEFMALGKSYI